jgi:hypothetical protein
MTVAGTTGEVGVITNLMVWSVVTTELEGRVIEGRYATEDEMVKVNSVWGSKATQIGGSPPYVLAQFLLRELAANGKKVE